MKPVYAITSNTEISYGETFSNKIRKMIKEKEAKKKIYPVSPSCYCDMK
jgi:hypothetical protein